MRRCLLFHYRFNVLTSSISSSAREIARKNREAFGSIGFLKEIRRRFLLFSTSSLSASFFLAHVYFVFKYKGNFRRSEPAISSAHRYLRAELRVTCFAPAN